MCMITNAHILYTGRKHGFKSSVKSFGKIVRDEDAKKTS